MSPVASFVLPSRLEAGSPPESRGIPRDGVRMMVAARAAGTIVHSHFRALGGFLREGDLVVVNTSGTLAAELDGTDSSGRPLQVHLSTELPAGLWSVELRRHGRPWLDASPGERVDLAGGGRVAVLSPYSRPGPPGQAGVRLWVASLALPEPLHPYLARHGRPIAYGYVAGRWPLSSYQNVYVTEPGSAEMPSAGRPFTPELVTTLVASGVGVAPVVLHTGVASLEASEPPYPEWYRVPAATANRVNDTHRDGGRVVAVGTTVVRALETVAGERGGVHPGTGWTDTVVTPERPPRAVDGLLTGWHEPEASHLALLEAVAGRDLLDRCYAAAVEEGYLWHEFGDVHLVLP
ncbi:MAG: S-adenosylmethionine:tRNA ribosyltransferase-isomerase [Acidimicrobiales bacterium]